MIHLNYTVSFYQTCTCQTCTYERYNCQDCPQNHSAETFHSSDVPTVHGPKKVRWELMTKSILCHRTVIEGSRVHKENLKDILLSCENVPLHILTHSFIHTLCTEHLSQDPHSLLWTHASCLLKHKPQSAWNFPQEQNRFKLSGQIEK